ncbi:lipopolysaccharide biosynthesis protein [Alteromonas ponticola]|uniref:Lipopolysaccharide biosynthesis protein n=1 Tax=Alteromonas ponticola TaxID=2720613 RepID=A0ABX1QXU0_9ALTE|nr:lipopolysaccharide biosynthesis protein [Alteromonas ponticola]NMH59058.1 lipopolysaccharide biosynthesis protein [Alteromonas ponticola]
MSELKAKTSVALIWSYLGKMGTQGVSIVVGILLARLLLPEDFGLIAICVIFSGLGTLLTDFGLTSALIQRQKLENSMLNSIFWLNTCFSIVIYLVVVSFAGPISGYFDQPQLSELLPLVMLTVVMGGLASVPNAILSKTLDFKSISVGSLVSVLLSAVIALTMAFNDYGVYALVAQQLATHFFYMCFIYIKSKWFPKFIFSLADIKSVFSFSVYVFSTQLLNYFAINLDGFLIGKYLSATQLGFFTRGKEFTLAPMRNIISSLNAVMFPSLSIIQHQKARVFNIYVQSIQLIGFVIFPILGGLFWISHELVFILLGEKWLPIVPLVKVFCVAGGLIGLASINGAVFKSQGKAKTQFLMNLGTKPITISCSVIGLQYGLMGVVYGFLVSKFINTIISQYVLCRTLEQPILSVWTVLLKPCFCLVSMLAVLWGVELQLSSSDTWLKLLILIPVGGISYLLVSLLIARDILFSVLEKFSSIKKGSKRA